MQNEEIQGSQDIISQLHLHLLIKTFSKAHAYSASPYNIRQQTDNT